jgi:hypothetical protein
MSTETCGICLEDFNTVANIAITKCGHITHLECFIKAIKTSDLCVYCRTELNIKSILNDEQPCQTTIEDLEYIRTNTEYIERFSMWNTRNQPTVLQRVIEIVNWILSVIIFSFVVKAMFMFNLNL